MLGCFTLTDAAPGAADQLLTDLAESLSRQGLRVVGAVQVNSGGSADCACDMDLRVLGDTGPLIRISQSLGPGAVACRLDSGALQTAAGRVSARLAERADICILPKFGKQEALGLGFRDVIAEALHQGVPVLIHVPIEQRAPFDAFAGEFAEWVDPAGLAEWSQRAMRQGKAA
ncbi:DUF2478 domain-containing protein [uncultured Paracoccus sp.]|uniref:DUF2478 domain-containing protein n=1 Tax=uncultured Paracoccus sp. TaxID=189685 RepID=UPI002611C97B|nr:DUF2478 domain-containing protein [uncultured Paracoccus sp.]